MSVIGVDLDGCLADFNTDYIAVVREVTGKDLFPTGYNKDVIETWSYPESFGYSKEEISAVWNHIAASSNFWLFLRPLDTAIECVQALDRLEDAGHAVYFITSRVGDQVKYQSASWLEEQGFWRPTVLISSEKGLCCKALKVNFYLDDKLENSLDVHDKSPATRNYMLAQPWNRPITLQQDGCVVPRIDTLKEFLDAIQN